MPRRHPQAEKHTLTAQVGVDLPPVVTEDAVPVALCVKPEVIHPQPLIADVAGGLDHLKYLVRQGRSPPDAQRRAVEIGVAGIVPFILVDVVGDGVAQIIEVPAVKAEGHGRNAQRFACGQGIVQQLAASHQRQIMVAAGGTGLPPALIIKGEEKALIALCGAHGKKFIPHAAAVETVVPCVAVFAVHLHHFRRTLRIKVLHKTIGDGNGLHDLTAGEVRTAGHIGEIDLGLLTAKQTHHKQRWLGDGHIRATFVDVFGEALHNGKARVSDIMAVNRQSRAAEGDNRLLLPLG